MNTTQKSDMAQPAHRQVGVQPARHMLVTASGTLVRLAVAHALLRTMSSARCTPGVDLFSDPVEGSVTAVLSLLGSLETSQ